MGKKAPKKQPRLVKTEVILKNRDYSHRILESYPTARKRAFDGRKFVEYTLKGGIKRTLNKDSIEQLGPIE